MTPKGVSPIASERPTSLIIGATKSPLYPSLGFASKLDSGFLSRALATATTASCQVDRKPLPPNFEPSGVSIPFVNISFSTSSIYLVLVINLCQFSLSEVGIDM